MKSRINVYWKGSRTTARFPEELWALALAVYDYEEEKLEADVIQMAKINDKPEMDHYTASGIVRQSLLHIVYNCIQLTKDQGELELA